MSIKLGPEIETKIEEFQHAVDKKVRAEIDACCCRTNNDWERYHRSENELYEMREQFENLLRKRLQEAFEQGKKAGQIAAATA